MGIYKEEANICKLGVAMAGDGVAPIAAGGRGDAKQTYMISGLTS